MAIVSYYHIPDSPADASFLTAEQKEIARRRLLVVRDGDGEDEGVGEGDVMAEEESRGVKWGQVWRAVKDLGNWNTAVSNFLRDDGGLLTSDRLCIFSAMFRSLPCRFFSQPY